MNKLPTLPLPLFQNTLGFAVLGYAEDLAPAKRTMTVAILKELESVAKTWIVPLREISQQYDRSAHNIVFEAASRRELREFYDKVERRGKDVTDLYVCMGTLYNYLFSQKFSLRQSLRDVVENVQIDWSRIFANLPELRVLNLAEMALASCHIIAVVEAASTYCFKLESLTLPYSDTGEDPECIDRVLKKLYEALKRWRVEGAIGGLRRLTVPTRRISPFRTSAECFENVMISCPEVERLDGYKMLLFTSNRLTCDDAWLLSLRDWEKFNATCKNLREFHWVVAPFGDPYFCIFGEHTKPLLRKLSYGVSMKWNWRWYFYDISDDAGAISDDNWEQQDYSERMGYVPLATNVSTALKACPLLDEIQVQLYTLKIPTGISICI